MKKVLPPLNDLISKRNPAVAVSNYTKTFIVPMKEDRVLTIKNSMQAVKGQAFAHQDIKFTSLGGLRTEK